MKNGTEGMELRSLQHDMRTPIANVIALAQLSMHALTAGTQESVMPYLSRILIAAKELEQLTGEMSGTDEAREERFTALDLAQTLGVLHGAQAAQKRQLLRIDVSGIGDAALIGDQTALIRVLTNLLSNAIKYTPEGGKIHLMARLTSRKADDAQMEIVVKDDGIGMKPEFKQRMFEPFERAPEAVCSRIEGCGLGLSIVRRLMQRLGGCIDVQSEWGKGTTFTLALPMKIDRGTSAALVGKHILLAEDNDLSAEIGQAILCGQGATVCRVSDGREAVKSFQDEPSGTFDAILMDMHMPEMSGCEAAQTIRASAHPDAGTVSIFALTAGGDAQDEREAIAAGMNGVLKKPLDVSRLRSVLIKEKG